MDGLTISNANKFIDSGGSKIGSANSTVEQFKTEKNNGKTFADTLNQAILMPIHLVTLLLTYEPFDFAAYLVFFYLCYMT